MSEVSPRATPNLLIQNDHGGDADGVMAAVMALQAGFQNVAIMVCGPHVGKPGQPEVRDVAASNERQQQDAAHVRAMLDLACEHYGLAPSQVPVFTGLPRDDTRVSGLRHIIPPHIDVHMSDMDTFGLYPEETKHARLAGGYNEAVDLLAGWEGPTVMLIGCAPSEAVALCNEPRLAGKIGHIAMQGSPIRRKTLFAEFSYNGDSDPQATFELFAKHGAHFLSSVITRDPALSVPDPSELLKRYPHIPGWLHQTFQKVHDTIDERNKQRQAAAGQLGSGRSSPIDISDARALTLLRQLAVPGAEQAFTETPVDVADVLQQHIRAFYPKHITPGFLDSLGFVVVDDKLYTKSNQGKDINTLPWPASYDVASIDHVDTAAAHRIANQLLVKA